MSVAGHDQPGHHPPCVAYGMQPARPRRYSPAPFRATARPMAASSVVISKGLGT